MRRFMLFALFALIPLACSTQTGKQTAKVDTAKAEDPDDDPEPTEKAKQPEKTNKSEPGAWVQLFNGVTLTGWKTHPDAPGKWGVENGVLIGNSPELSFLYSERDDYQNFHVRMEAKISDKADSGLFFRATMPKAKDAAGGKKGGKGGPGNPKGYEAQINNSGTGAGGGTLTGSLLIGGGGGTTKTSYSQKLVGPDEWFTQEVIAEGTHIQILINGKQTVDYKPAEGQKALYSKGHFAIQSKAPGIDKGGAKGAGGAKAAGKKAAKKAADPAGGGTYDQIIYVRKFEVKELPQTAGK